MMDDRNGMGPQSGYIGRITNDAREDEMEENVGQVRRKLAHTNLNDPVVRAYFLRNCLQKTKDVFVFFFKD